MTPDVIQALAQFMERVDLKGSEVAAWTTCMEQLKRELLIAQTAQEKTDD
jgi:hypothetical protein